MRTFIFWNGKYKGVVGGALWDQFIINARAGYGTLHLIDGESVADAKSRMTQAIATNIPNVFALANLNEAVQTKIARIGALPK